MNFKCEHTLCPPAAPQPARPLLDFPRKGPVLIFITTGWGWPVSELHKTGIIQHVLVCVWLLWLNIAPMRVTYIVVYSSTLFSFSAITFNPVILSQLIYLLHKCATSSLGLSWILPPWVFLNMTFGAEIRVYFSWVEILETISFSRYSQTVFQSVCLFFQFTFLWAVYEDFICLHPHPYLILTASSFLKKNLVILVGISYIPFLCTFICG